MCDRLLHDDCRCVECTRVPTLADQMVVGAVVTFLNGGTAEIAKVDHDSRGGFTVTFVHGNTWTYDGGGRWTGSNLLTPFFMNIKSVNPPKFKWEDARKGMAFTHIKLVGKIYWYVSKSIVDGETGHILQRKKATLLVNADLDRLVRAPEHDKLYY